MSKRSGSLPRERHWLCGPKRATPHYVNRHSLYKNPHRASRPVPTVDDRALHPGRICRRILAAIVYGQSGIRGTVKSSEPTAMERPLDDAEGMN